MSSGAGEQPRLREEQVRESSVMEESGVSEMDTATIAKVSALLQGALASNSRAIFGVGVRMEDLVIAYGLTTIATCIALVGLFGDGAVGSVAVGSYAVLADQLIGRVARGGSHGFYLSLLFDLVQSFREEHFAKGTKREIRLRVEGVLGNVEDGIF